MANAVIVCMLNVFLFLFAVKMDMQLRMQLRMREYVCVENVLLFRCCKSAIAIANAIAKAGIVCVINSCLIFLGIGCVFLYVFTFFVL